jgi:putative ABC transport system substrate-binding protein
VFTNVADPVGQGFIESLARPGANATGFTNFEFAMGGKWLATLKDIAPRAARIALIVNPDNPNASIFLRSVETVAPSLGVETLATPVRNQTEIEGAFSALPGGSVAGLIVLPDGLALLHSQLIIGLAARYHLPVIYPFREFVDQGGLVSYGIKFSENYRQAADYVDRILRGANPAHLPVQAPTKFELVINLKTAKALGLDVPVQLQQLADEVIE